MCDVGIGAQHLLFRARDCRERAGSVGSVATDGSPEHGTDDSRFTCADLVNPGQWHGHRFVDGTGE